MKWISVFGKRYQVTSVNKGVEFKLTIPGQRGMLVVGREALMRAFRKHYGLSPI